MAIELTSKTNTEAASAEYPYGQFKDNTGSNNGTPLNKAVLEDYLQFFHKMMSEAGITYTGVPDNEYDGWQFFEAFENLTKVMLHNDIAATSPVTGNVYTSVRNYVLPLSKLKIEGDSVEIEGFLTSVIESGTTRFFKVVLGGVDILGGSTSVDTDNKHKFKCKITRITATTVRVDFEIYHIENGGDIDVSLIDRTTSVTIPNMDLNTTNIDVQLKTTGTTDSITSETFSVKYFRTS